MRILIKSITMLMMMLLTVAVSGKTNFDDFRVSTINRNTINLHLSNTDGKSEIKMFDEAGILLYGEEVKNGTFSKRFNFELLPDGNYTIEVIGQTKITSIPLVIKNATINVVESEKKVTYKPIVRVIGDLIYVSKYSETAENISMVLSENDSKLYESNVMSHANFGKALDIKNLPMGNYKLMINYGERSLETNIKK